MKILVVAPEGLSTSKGPHLVIRALIEEWKRSNEVTLLQTPNSYPLISGVRKIELSAHRPLQWVVRLLRGGPSFHYFDIIFDTGFTLPTILRSRFVSLPPIILMVQGNPFIEAILKKGWVGKLAGFGRDFVYMSACIELADCVLTVSEKVRDDLVRMYGRPGRFFWIENGVFLKDYFRTGVNRENFILFVGNVHLDYKYEIKGIPTLLKAVSKIREEIQDVKLVIAGRVGSRVASDCKMLGISSNVFCTGLVDQSQLLDLYNRAGVVVIPSAYDAYAMVTNEAMACGAPLVVSNMVGSYPIVERAKGGLIFQSGNSIDLANKLRDVLSDSELRDTLGDNGYSYAREHLDWSRVAPRYLSLFRRCLATRGDPLHASS